MKYRENKDSLKKGILRLLGIVIVLAVLSVTIATAERVGDVPTDTISSASTGIVTYDLNSGLTATDLVTSLLGGGVTVSNVVFTGNNRAAGLFTGGTGIIGFESGVILSSGDIRNVIGPNAQNGITTVNGFPGDAALNSLIPGYTTYDSANLEFDFVPTTSQMTFSYVFGSDEYNEYANTAFNDVFGFFVNGNSAPFNIALLPGVTPATPVSINNVNGGNPLGTNAKNPAFYRNNALYPVPPGATINTELDGLTVVLTATANINPGVTNHIKLAIADAGDSILDSDVFIQGGSVISLQLSLAPLSAENDVGESHTLTAKLVTVTNVPIPGETITFTVSGPNVQTGSAVTNSEGIATWSYTGSNPGTDTIVATGGGETSNSVSKTWIQTNTPPVANPGGPYSCNEGSACNFDGSASYDPDTGDSIVSYEWDLDNDGIFEANGVTVSKTWTDDYSGAISLKVTDTKGATNTKSTTVTVSNVAPAVDAGADQVANEGDTVSFSGSFTDPGADTHTIAWNFGDGGSASGTLTPTHVYADNGVYTVTLTVTDKDGGVGTDTMTVTVNNVAPSVNAGADQSAYSGDTVYFSGSYTDPAGALDAPYTTAWDFGDGTTATGTLTPSHVYLIPNTYTVTLTVTDDDGGKGSDTLTVTVTAIPVAIDIKPGSFPNSINLGNEGTVPVAILSTATFDATSVNPLTVTLASAPVKLKGKGTPMSSREDVNGDGLFDLVVHVSTAALDLSQNDVAADLEGQTYDWKYIKGSDSVRIVPP